MGAETNNKSSFPLVFYLVFLPISCLSEQIYCISLLRSMSKLYQPPLIRWIALKWNKILSRMWDRVSKDQISCKISIIFSQVLLDILTLGLWNAKGNVFEMKYYCVNKSEQADTISWTHPSPKDWQNRKDFVDFIKST